MSALPAPAPNLALLSPREREVYQLLYRDGLSRPAIAERLGIKVSSVWQALYTAHRRLERGGPQARQGMTNIVRGPHDERLLARGRCACGLLLPCYGKHRIDEYAAERT